MSMSLKGLRFGFFAFFVLSAGVAVNLLFLQPKTMGTVGVAQARSAPTARYLETASLDPASDRVAKRRSARRPPPKTTGVGTASIPVVLNSISGEVDSVGPRPGRVGVRSRFLPVNTGNTAELVRAIQRELKNNGYDPGAEDGAIGLVTRAAIFAFQYDHNLDVTAEPSEKLLQTIVLGGSGQKKATPRRAMVLQGDARDLVLATQRGLKQQGFWPAPVDGHFNTALSRAIQQFETTQRLSTTGRISGRFMARLVRLSGVGRESRSR